MPSLVAGYGSSDDESPSLNASTSLPTLGGSFNSNEAAVDDNEDDEKIEEEAKKDAFGLTSMVKSEREAESKRQKEVVTSAPDVLKEDPNGAGMAIITRPTDKVMNVNLTFEEMSRPVAGPENPFDKRKNKGMNTLSGHVEEQSMDDYSFLMAQRTFDVHGYAVNPSIQNTATPIVGSLANAYQNGYNSIENIRPTRSERKETKRKRGGKGDASVVDGEGAYMGPWANWQQDKQEAPVVEEEEDDEEWREEKRRREEASAAAKEKMKTAMEEKSIFHGKELYDYAGRTYMHIPTDKDVKLNPSDGAPPPNAYLPERCIHTWTGHNKAVSAVRLFPRSGHLLLSASMDTKVKLWDVYNEGNCLRTFLGHSQAVKDIAFNNSGDKFLSASYDKHIKLWDTETGKCIQAFTNGKIPNVVKFNPDGDKQHIFMAGMQDKKIIQYDLREREIVQTYDQHLGPVNTITFVDENRRFVTTSDDKTIRGWDYDIPVVIKYIAEPYMHSMPAVTLHPSKRYFACQSLDNQILVYSADGSFRQNKKKRFAGHTIAGYACNIGFSPDGKYISSGTGSGEMVFWDWKSGKIMKRLKAHKEVVIDHAWLPNEHSKLVTASWDGLIKLWT
ncbi:pre-mRNA-processing factor 17 [Cryptococcus deuterogattii 99/473]|uniref:Pre-mRNA-processing factor 17 n=2 Tax=Cryptococcus deuterogattii TaxID=1859096 RepID=A0A0D0VAS4_9TREE|nr:pre-mRNA-processing factor 17 [Cryptococcus deuterogattii R265]KIR27573.1 pre-mRNA-processing factor 17 [Cryptococcus deuterogattii LA55]KIR33341.1 pre-mRNA-processing factor 17 [Cryptococcus deuterogattii MMRL2647]KIR41915.1 pre-mRNA-processing factor 17 [Cryptococcus deuterogattii Ram5]KIR73260.1 pre-mRNA-processing factor 17 [Cryptococcus deuterogattii CA1014]KIR91595.1 pre-mRNA-processing factor 17 [Cryptococcus deuterogattii CBS 10090]KIY59971.1 pre-mRNA-processing factor 17 [Cryptoco